MTVLSFFHNSVAGDRVYEADDFAKHTGTIVGDGVVEGLKVTYTNAYAYTIDVGKAIVMGRSVVNDAIIATSIGTPVNGDIYSVVVRMDLTARAASIETILGTAYQDDNAIKQIPLATILVGTNTLTITDKRSFVSYKSDKVSIKNSALKYTHTAGTEFSSVNFKEGSDTTGMGMAVGAGGTTVVGGGESAAGILANTTLVPDTITEKLILASDYAVEVWSGMQDVGTNPTVGKRFIFSTNGDFNIGGNNVDPLTCTLRYTSATKTLGIWHWTGTAVENNVILNVGDVAFQNNAWITLPLNSPGVMWSSGQVPEYSKQGGVCYIQGAMKGIAYTGSSIIISTLPVGYRPTRTSQSFSLPTSANKHLRITVNEAGQIVLEGVTGGTMLNTDWIPLTMSFRID